MRLSKLSVRVWFFDHEFVVQRVGIHEGEALDHAQCLAIGRYFSGGGGA